MIKDNLKKLENNKEFIKWKQNNPSFLNSILIDEPIQFNFYNPKTDKFTTFTLAKELKKEESEVFRKEKNEMKELELDKVKVSYQEVLDKVNQIIKKYKNTEKKKIIILQQRDHPIWLINYLSNELNILSLVINATNLEIEQESFENILSFKK